MKLNMLKNRRGQWYMRLEKNGRIIMHSESYHSKSACKRAMKMMWMNPMTLYEEGDPMVMAL